MVGIYLVMRHNPVSTWETCKDELSGQIPPNFFSRFIEPLELIEYDSESQSYVLLSRRDSGSSRERLHLQEKYAPVIEQKLRSLMQSQVRIQILEENRQAVQPQEQNTNKAQTVPFFPSEADQKWVKTLLNQLKTAPSPFIVKGPSGSGKTHLARNLSLHYNGKYLTIDQFLTEMASAFENKTALAWKKSLHEAPVLIIDDFQFIKPTAKRCQEELRHLIDSFSRNEKPVLFFTDMDLADHPVAADLMNRLKSGVVTELHYADRNARLAVIGFEARQHHIDIKESDRELLAEKLTGDMRKLKGALKKYSFFGHERFESLIQSMTTEPQELHSEVVFQVIYKEFHTDKQMLCSPKRERKLVFVRHITAWLLQNVCSLTLEEIAGLLGRKDHSAVLYGIRKIKDRAAKDLFLETQLEELRQKVFEMSRQAFAGKTDD